MEDAILRNSEDSFTHSRYQNKQGRESLVNTTVYNLMSIALTLYMLHPSLPIN